MAPIVILVPRNIRYPCLNRSVGSCPHGERLDHDSSSFSLIGFRPSRIARIIGALKMIGLSAICFPPNLSNDQCVADAQLENEQHHPVKVVVLFEGVA